jgi:hypothetical protein
MSASTYLAVFAPSHLENGAEDRLVMMECMFITQIPHGGSFSKSAAMNP